MRNSGANKEREREEGDSWGSAIEPILPSTKMIMATTARSKLNFIVPMWCRVCNLADKERVRSTV